jgi:hypothetical protein
MSHFEGFQTQFTDKEALIRALCRCQNAYGKTISRSMIEDHEEPQNLYGY